MLCWDFKNRVSGDFGVGRRGRLGASCAACDASPVCRDHSWFVCPSYECVKDFGALQGEQLALLS